MVFEKKTRNFVFLSYWSLSDLDGSPEIKMVDPEKPRIRRHSPKKPGFV